MKLLSAILILSIATHALADERTAKTHFFSTFAGQSLMILGSEDIREGGGFAYAYGRPEPQFSLKNVPAQWVSEMYIDRTWSPHGGDPTDEFGKNTVALGGLMYGRWRWPVTPRTKTSFYTDFGWGIQYATRSTHDLDSQWNSTPMLGLGAACQFGSQELLIGLRLLHISNAGTVGHNRGQNQLFFTIGVRY